MPAKAGIQIAPPNFDSDWVPAFAGMTSDFRF
jgi:hypothetical protein